MFRLSSFFWRIADNVHKSDVIVAVGIGLRSDGSLSNLSKSVTNRAAELYKEQFSSKIIFTGGFVQKNRTEAEAMAAYAIKQGVLKKDIIVEKDSISTPTNAKETLKILKKKNFKSALLVAQHIHARRVRFLFKKILGANYKTYWTSAVSTYDSVPGQKRLLSEYSFLLWEIFWMITYRIVGYKRFS